MIIMDSLAWRQKTGSDGLSRLDFEDDGKVVYFMLAVNLGIMTTYLKIRSKSYGI